MNDILTAKLQNFFFKKPIKKAWLFGSYARGEESIDSDIDILVEYDDDYRPGLFGIAALIEELENLTGKKIDLVENGFLYPRIAKEVEPQKIKIYERTNS